MSCASYEIYLIGGEGKKIPLNLKAFIFLFFIFSSFGHAQADTVYLKSGANVEGIIKAKGKGFIELEVSGGVIKLQKDEIAWIVESPDGAKRELREKWGLTKASIGKKIDAQGRMEDLGPRQVEFMRGQQGMVVDAIINGKLNVRLIFDTGASLVILKKNLANELGINPVDIKPDMKIILADGRSSGAQQIVLHSVMIEGMEVKNVDAAILADDTQEDWLGEGLLGMSFLKHFDFKIDQRNNKLILEKLQQ